jgi:hypothetical protein
MSDVIDINALRKEFQEKTKAKDIKAFAETQQALIEKLLQEKAVLEEKTKQLEKTLTDFASGTLTLPLSKEEAVCREQLEFIRKKSVQRALSLEDVKIFDILVKNLKLIQEGYKTNPEKDNFRDVEEINLVAIASRPE